MNVWQRRWKTKNSKTSFGKRPKAFDMEENMELDLKSSALKYADPNNRHDLSEEKQDFLRRFESFWSKPSGSRVRELIAADAQIHFAGQGMVSGEEYVGLMDAMLAGVETIEVNVVDYAERGDRLFIFWSASRLADGKRLSWHGVDRFRIENGMAVEEQVIFDTQVMSGG
jgi:hypothetical protein